MADKKVRVGVIGAGGIANGVHLPSLTEIEDCEVVALCDLRYEKAVKTAEKFGIKKTYWDMYEMIEKEELDCVRKKCECLYAEVEEHRRRAEHVQDMCNADVYQRAVHTYGETSRLILTIEEMSELTKELSKRMRGRNNMPAICEEMADVEIMLEQLKIVFNNRAAVDYHKAHKLQRLADRMDGAVD